MICMSYYVPQNSMYEKRGIKRKVAVKALHAGVHLIWPLLAFFGPESLGYIIRNAIWVEIP